MQVKKKRDQVHCISLRGCDDLTHMLRDKRIFPVDLLALSILNIKASTFVSLIYFYIY